MFFDITKESSNSSAHTKPTEVIGHLWAQYPTNYVPLPERLKPLDKEINTDATWLHYILIDDIFRGKGYGSKSIQAFEEYMRENNQHVLMLNAYPNEKDFYLKQAFNIISGGEGQQSWKLAKPLYEIKQEIICELNHGSCGI